jgi:hypothetical protein
MAKPDPTKEPEFQKVVRHFLATPHKPHKPLGVKKAAARTLAAAKSRKKRP